MSDGYYDVAQICMNGHVINWNSQGEPDHNQEHCSECGVETTVSCSKCDTPIKGAWNGPIGDEHRDRRTNAPAFCHKCGAQFPWTQTALLTARELADTLEKLKPEERDVLKKTLPDLMAETPRTPLAVMKFKRLMRKAGDEGYQAMKGALLNIACEAVKGLLFGP
jgi:hypothetical protein